MGAISNALKGEGSSRIIILRVRKVRAKRRKMDRPESSIFLK